MSQVHVSPQRIDLQPLSPDGDEAGKELVSPAQRYQTARGDRPTDTEASESTMTEVAEDSTDTEAPFIFNPLYVAFQEWVFNGEEEETGIVSLSTML